MKNEGNNMHRFKYTTINLNALEKAFADTWEEENTNPYGELNGKGILDYLLAENPNEPRGEVTDRDRMVAATVIQWLGSSVGQSFLTQVGSDRYHPKLST